MPFICNPPSNHPLRWLCAIENDKWGKISHWCREKTRRVRDVKFPFGEEKGDSCIPRQWFTFHNTFLCPVNHTHTQRQTDWGYLFTHTNTPRIISHRVQTKLSWDKPTSAFISQKSNAHPYSKLLLINSEHQNWTTLNASKSKVNHPLRVSSCESTPTDSHVKMSFTANTHSWVTVCLPDRSWSPSSTCTHFAYFDFRQASSNIRHWHDGDVGTASSELRNCSSETNGWRYVHLYLQSMNCQCCSDWCKYVRDISFFQLSSTQVKLVRKARTKSKQPNVHMGLITCDLRQIEKIVPQSQSFECAHSFPPYNIIFQFYKFRSVLSLDYIYNTYNMFLVDCFYFPDHWTL